MLQYASMNLTMPLFFDDPIPMSHKEGLRSMVSSWIPSYFTTSTSFLGHILVFFLEKSEDTDPYTKEDVFNEGIGDRTGLVSLLQGHLLLGC